MNLSSFAARLPQLAAVAGMARSPPCKCYAQLLALEPVDFAGPTQTRFLESEMIRGRRESNMEPARTNRAAVQIA
jgi:hypothetical protein